MSGEVLRGEFERRWDGPEWRLPDEQGGVVGGRAWLSHGGGAERHPARAFPRELRAVIPPNPARITEVRLYGIFALYAEAQYEPLGAVGATLRVEHDGAPLFRIDLIQGRHYGASSDTTPLYRPNGDGTCLQTVGTVEWGGEEHRVDVLSWQLPRPCRADELILWDSGTSASFAIFDVVLESETVAVCPFRGHGDRIALSDLGGILRLRDYTRFQTAVAQFRAGVESGTGSLDEAKGLALTFLAVISAALLELGASRTMHEFQLTAAREVDQFETRDEISLWTEQQAWELTELLFGRRVSQSDRQIKKALDYIELHLGRRLSDEEVAESVGLSTSHFRHLFKQATRQPFHKYVMSLRLEKARELLQRGGLRVSDVSRSLGFVSPAHFSRVFAKRFGASPSSLIGDQELE